MCFYQSWSINKSLLPAKNFVSLSCQSVTDWTDGSIRINVDIGVTTLTKDFIWLEDVSCCCQNYSLRSIDFSESFMSEDACRLISISSSATTKHIQQHNTQTQPTTMSNPSSRYPKHDIKQTISFEEKPSPPPSLHSSSSDDDDAEDNEKFFIDQHDKNCSNCNVAGVPVKYHSFSKGDLNCCFSCNLPCLHA